MRRREELEYYKGLRETLKNNSLFSDAALMTKQPSNFTAW